MGTMLDRFEEHDGPVRGIAFHPSQPLFVSGGDDYKIRVWNYKTRRCLFTLTGHMDYVRTVSFHHEHPWILSASDDQTLRIWNWQSRQCVATITGHNHYVMCAQFHPTEDLIVSASMDQTVRVWDFTGLRKKVSARSQPSTGTGASDEFMSRASGMSSAGAGAADVFGHDVIVKFVLEGHDRGVDWASFHPVLPLIVSSGDDRQIKLWRMSETRAWEVDTLRGHTNNVSCVLFHPREELLLSDSEDKTLRVWDIAKRTTVQTFRRENDRFWVMAAHPEMNLFAAGHDSGLMIFKLDRERPASCMHQNTLFYVKDKQIWLYDFQNGSDIAVMSVRKSATGFQQPRSISYNPAERAVLVCTSNEGGQYDLYSIPRDSSRGGLSEPSEPMRGIGSTAVFVSRNRFAVLDKASNQILIKDSANTTTKTIKPSAVVTEIFFAGPGHLLLATATSVILHDIQQRQNIAELNVGAVKYVVWSSDMSMIALMSKHMITIASGKLEQKCQVHETIRIKSGCWDDSGVFLYTTLNHIKYTLPQGDNGIIKTLEKPVYLARVKGSTLYALDRDGQIEKLMIQPAEYLFKLALVQHRYDDVLELIRSSNLIGQAVIAYLQKKGYSEVALHFVKDRQTRFDLAIECGNMDVALETAKAIDKEECWQKLATEALRQGNLKVVEMAYQRVKSFERLSFLYLLTGNTEKLQKMLKIAELRNDSLSRFHNALYLGDVEERVKVLVESNQLSLAYLTAKSHGLHEQAAIILELAGKTEDDISMPEGGKLLQPPPPVVRQTANWPLLEVPTSSFFGGGFQVVADTPLAAAMSARDMQDAEFGGDWDTELTGIAPVEDIVAGEEVEAAWGIDEVEIEGLPTGEDGDLAPPTAGTSEYELWCSNSPVAADHVAAGSFESAMQLLNRQIGIVHFEPLKEQFMTIATCSRAYITAVPCVPPLEVPLRRSGAETDPRKILPSVGIKFRSLVTGLLQDAYKATTAGKFQDATVHFRKLLQTLTVTSVTTEAEADELKQLIGICREYILGLTMERERRELAPEDLKRALELSAYFTQCQIQAIHQQLSLRSAMTLCFKAKNFQSASLFARRLLDLNPGTAVATQARQIKAASDKTPKDEIQLDYDQYSSFQICAGTHKPLYKGTISVECPYCQANYEVDFKGSLCSVCEVAEVGMSVTGLRVLV